MLWLSDDDGDPPWWMWVIMVGITLGLGWLFFSTGREWLLNSSSRLAALPFAISLGWWFVRLVFWFDNS